MSPSLGSLPRPEEYARRLAERRKAANKVPEIMARLDRLEQALDAHRESLSQLPASFFGEVTEVNTKQSAMVDQIQGIIDLVRSLPFGNMIEALQVDLPDYSPQFNDLSRRIVDAHHANDDRLDGLASQIASTMSRLDTQDARMRDVEARTVVAVASAEREPVNLQIRVTGRDKNGDIRDVEIRGTGDMDAQ